MSARFAGGLRHPGSGPVALPLPACGERVGVRGPLGWAHDLRKISDRSSFACVAQNRGEAPSPSVASLPRPLPARRGEVKRHRADKQNHPRDAHAPELCLPPRTKEIRPRQSKGGEAPKGACQPCAALRTSGRELAHLIRCAAARRCRRRARLPALRPRLLPGFPSRLSSRPCFLGLGIRRTLPAHSCPSPVTAPHASAVIPKGMMPEAAPARIASPRGSTASRPTPQIASGMRPSMSEIFLTYPKLGRMSSVCP